MSETQALIPVRQDTVDFDGYPVIGVQLPDGRIGASLRDMCDAMKIDRPSQVQRIRGDETITDSLISVQIQTRGGPQTADFLTAWAIPYWLTGVETSRIKDEKKRQAILLFKRRAADVLYQHFSQRQLLLEPSRAIVPAEPMQPAPDADALAWAEYHRQMAAFYQWKATTDMRIDTLETQYQSVEERLESYKPVLDLVPEILERLGPQTLTPEHQQAIHDYADQLHELTGKPYPTIWSSLKTAFRVAKYADIPELDWPRVVKWFQAQLEQKRKR
jgi:hypothetical protein